MFYTYDTGDNTNNPVKNRYFYGFLLSLRF